MKILHVYRTYFPDTQGGLEEAIRQLCLGTGRLGIENRIFTLTRNRTPSVLSLPEATVYRFPLTCEIASCGFSLRCLSGFKQLVEWADIVHYQFPWPFADMLHFMTKVRKPAVLTYQSDIVRQRVWFRLYRPLMLRFLAAMDAIVTTSPHYAASSPVLPTLQSKLHVIPIGLDPCCIPEALPHDKAWVLQQFGEGYFLFVGMLRYYKGLEILLQAAAHVHHPIVIAGTGPLADQLQQQAQKMGLHHVFFTGRVSQSMKSALLQFSRAIVFPSHLRSEAFGVTLLEGAMFGKPLISTEIGTGTSYINRHQQTGLVIPPNNSEALGKAMLCLVHDAELVSQLGQGARDRYEAMFTASKVAEAYKHLYMKILEGR